jgi:regulation of enolase protein 1 (concanavalin A-like superfamily)
MPPSLRETLQPFRWANEPAAWRLDAVLEVMTRPDTDYWQRTHYGFRRDNGHFFFTTLTADFSLAGAFAFQPTAQYDQCGLMVRADADNWIKCSVEYETPEFSRLGSVVTNLGFSDWATQDLTGAVSAMHYKVDRRGDDFRISWSTGGLDWRQMRITHLHRCPEALEVGVYACSPVGAGFVCRVEALTLGPLDWGAHG